MSLSGCSLLDDHVPAAYELSETKVAVIPFDVKISGNRLGFFKSKTGTRIASNVSTLVATNGDEVKVLKANQLATDVGSLTLKEPDWGRICKKHDIDKVIVGSILHFSHKLPNQAGILQGNAQVQIRVIDAEGQTVFSRTTKHYFPKLSSTDPQFAKPGGSSFNMTPDQILQGLEMTVAEETAKLFYGHFIEK